MFPERLTKGYRAFLDGRFVVERGRYQTLAGSGQSPSIMVIGCVDSRVSPEVIFDAAPGEIEHHLVGAGEVPIMRAPLLHVVEIEVAHAEIGDLAVLSEAMERLEGFRERHAAAPMQQIEIDPVDAHALEAALAGFDRAATRCIVWIDLADDIEPVAASGCGSPIVYDVIESEPYA